MVLKYGFDIDKTAVAVELKRLTNQVYKLLPSREEGLDWEKPLSTILEELAGIQSLFMKQQVILFRLTSKLEGLFILQSANDFQTFRGVIFECLGLLGELTKACLD